MGQAPSTAKARKALSSVIAKGEAADTKQMMRIFAYYDTDSDGKLSWHEAKRYLNDLLEVS